MQSGRLANRWKRAAERVSQLACCGRGCFDLRRRVNSSWAFKLGDNENEMKPLFIRHSMKVVAVFAFWLVLSAVQGEVFNFAERWRLC
ncbi:MAG: hypothetical protein DMF76_23495 [Acidobacteria bacterium]|nr:MAG: hypothetical protein DMF76_23495 [Acidobacteriota bacterium]